MNADVEWYNFLSISHFFKALIILHSRVSSLGYCHSFLDVSLCLHMAVESILSISGLPPWCLSTTVSP